MTITSHLQLQTNALIQQMREQSYEEEKKICITYFENKGEEHTKGYVEAMNNFRERPLFTRILYALGWTFAKEESAKKTLEKIAK